MMFALLLTGCNDFLKETSQDEVRPSTVSDLEQILVGEAYLSDYNIYNITDIFTDNMECYGVQNEKMQEIFDGLKWRYTWDDDMFAVICLFFGKFLTRGSGDVTWCWIIWIKCMERLICGRISGGRLSCCEHGIISSW